MTEKKRGRGRPKGAPNKPKMKLITERKELQNNADAYEILCQANIVAEKEPELAVQGLKVFNDRNGAIKPILQWAFDDNINSTLPEGKTPYGRNAAPATDLTETSLRFEHKQFKYFVTEQVPTTKREALWIGLLEGIPKEEAELLDLLKDGVWAFPNITKEIAVSAFPEISR
jgi:hypothetical protein|tara:strand:+ start:573 stop:1088 length:516 start_codon:yes stop_codon:yes gene_type:complete